MEKLIHACCYLLLLTLHTFGEASDLYSRRDMLEGDTIEIPIGGNSWVREGHATVTDQGLGNWTDTKALCTTYIRSSQAGTLRVSLRMNPEGGESTLRVSIGKTSVSLVVGGDNEAVFYAGEWSVVQPSYVAIEIQGVQKSQNTFGTLSSLVISGSSINNDAAYVKNNDGNFFYWGRRGPSVHLNYATKNIENIEWFYNEVSVPENNDVIGSYFMATGFKEGYFGMQVNSENERRILFSVWSPYPTDDPASIPASEKIQLIKKGKHTHTGEFGNEGAGGQSYVKYYWKAGATYKFLLQGKPVGENSTQYTAYFFAPEENRWMLIASFKRPKTGTYLTH